MSDVNIKSVKCELVADCFLCDPYCYTEMVPCDRLQNYHKISMK